MTRPSCQPPSSVFFMSSIARAHVHCQATTSQGRNARGPRSFSSPARIFLYSHTQHGVCSYYNNHKRNGVQIDAFRLFALVFSFSLLCFFFLYFCVFSPSALVKNSLAVMSIWRNDILNFQGLYINWITLPSSLQNPLYLLSTDCSRL